MAKERMDHWLLEVKRALVYFLIFTLILAGIKTAQLRNIPIISWFVQVWS